MQHSVREDSQTSAFTLVELMIVIAIIAVIVAVAVPSLSNARFSANSAAAISELRGMISEVEAFRGRNGRLPLTLKELQDAGYAQKLDLESTAVGTTSSYLFLFSRLGETAYIVRANPKVFGKTGLRYFVYLTAKGTQFEPAVMYYSDDAGVNWAIVE